MSKQVGVFTQKIISILNLNIPVETPIFIGEQNIAHIESKHSHDYYHYGHLLEDIIANPDYVGIVPKDKSIEYIKEVSIDPNVKIKIAIRVTPKGIYFVRTFYNVQDSHIKKALAKGMLYKV